MNKYVLVDSLVMDIMREVGLKEVLKKLNDRKILVWRTSLMRELHVAKGNYL